jgi:pimeloyl-ACP methyl ester carboxylesterase
MFRTQRGHGRSDKPRPQLPRAYDWSDLGDDVAAALTTLGVTHALGVGHSSGGYMLAHVAVRATPSPLPSSELNALWRAGGGA